MDFFIIEKKKHEKTYILQNKSYKIGQMVVGSLLGTFYQAQNYILLP